MRLTILERLQFCELKFQLIVLPNRNWMPQRLLLKPQRTRRLKRPLVVAPLVVAPLVVAMRLSEEQARQRVEVVVV